MFYQNINDDANNDHDSKILDPIACIRASVFSLSWNS